MGDGYLFRQLLDYDTNTYTYLLADARTTEAVLIDPVLEQVDRDLKLIEELELQLRFILDTHVHADHITAASRIREATGARTVVGKGTGVAGADLMLGDGETITFGGITVKAIATPGHTSGCTSYLVPGAVFTGDALFVRGTGRTDFQQGSAELLYESITRKLFTLPDDTLVYPAHDYRGFTRSTIGEEKRYNPRVHLGVSKEAFVRTMSALKLDNPKRIDEAVPANLACGKV